MPPAVDSAPSFVLGVLAAEADSISQFRREFKYDTLARSLKAHTRIDGGWYTACQTYDKYGRAKQAFDATGEGVANTYTDGGHLLYVRDGGTITAPTTIGGIYWERRGTDARGNVTVERLADNASLETSRGYEASTGRLLSIQTGSAIAGYKYQDLAYTYDFHGNLKSRADKSLYFDVAGMVRANDLKEEFVYDSRDRLLTATRTRLAGAVDTKVLLSQTYDALGNQLTRTSGESAPVFIAGTYEYRTTPAGCTQAGPHALSKVGSTTWCYDANGNQTKEFTSTSDYRDITWTGFDLPEKIVRRVGPIGVEQSTEYRYAPDRSRYKRIDRTLSVSVPGLIFRSSFEDGETDPQGPPATTITVGNVEYYTLGTLTRVRRNIGGFLIVYRENTNAPTNQYVLHDGLGSVDAIVSTVSGLALLQKPSFDAYGLRRNGDNGQWSALPLATLYNNGASQVTLRGYTGHEQIDTAALVHMNGRLYDPRVGRFVQGDPLVDDPSDPQAYNRYAYVGNNPLSAVDPMGYSRQGARNAGGAIVGFIMLGLGPVGWTAQAVAWAAFQGALVGVIVTGNAQGAVWGAVSAVTFHGIGQAYPGVPQGTAFSEAVQSGAYWSKIAAHGAAAGVLTELQGGDFGHAFVSAGVSAALSPAFDFEGGSSGQAKGLVASAIVGGTASELVGGKFANGAATAAFAYAFSSIARNDRQNAPKIDCDRGGCYDATAMQSEIDRSPQFVGNDTGVGPYY